MMKLYCFLLLTITGFVQNTADPIDAAADLIKKGNAHEFVKMFSSSVELTILKDDGIYSSTQSELILENFFKGNTPRSVSILHTVKSNPNFRFAVLMLNTSSGTYRTSVSLKINDGKFVVTELRIESEKK